MSFTSLEYAVMDECSGLPMNANLTEYHIPMNAVPPSMEAIQVEENDHPVDTLGINGVGEIGTAALSPMRSGTQPGSGSGITRSRSIGCSIENRADLRLSAFHRSGARIRTD